MIFTNHNIAPNNLLNNINVDKFASTNTIVNKYKQFNIDNIIHTEDKKEIDTLNLGEKNYNNDKEENMAAAEEYAEINSGGIKEISAFFKIKTFNENVIKSIHIQQSSKDKNDDNYENRQCEGNIIPNVSCVNNSHDEDKERDNANEHNNDKINNKNNNAEIENEKFLLNQIENLYSEKVKELQAKLIELQKEVINNSSS